MNYACEISNVIFNYVCMICKTKNEDFIMQWALISCLNLNSEYCYIQIINVTNCWIYAENNTVKLIIKCHIRLLSSSVIILVLST